MFILTKLSLIGNLIVLITFFAKIFGILEKRYADIIMIVIAIMQVLLIVTLIIMVIMRIRKSKFIKIIRYRLHDTLVKGETDIIPENISPTHPKKATLFKIFLEIENISEVPEMGISKTNFERGVLDIKDYIINVNAGILDNSFIFDADIMVKPGEKINFQIKKDTFVKSFFLGEFYIP
jgi:hypothetical protein